MKHLKYKMHKLLYSGLSRPLDFSTEQLGKVLHSNYFLRMNWEKHDELFAWMCHRRLGWLTLV